jgi:multidrug resistance efflux pump
MKRRLALSNVAVSEERQQQARAAAAEAEAAYQQAQADRDLAQLNLDRSDVIAPVNGVITDFSLRPGNYVSTGKPIAALVDSDSFYIAGYFEETKLPRIHVGDKVSIRLLGEPNALEGHVESFAAGIEDRERAQSSNLLPNVNPTFSWVRLAQRVPVRVAIDTLPANVRLVAGRTATVTIRSSAGTIADTPNNRRGDILRGRAGSLLRLGAAHGRLIPTAVATEDAAGRLRGRTSGLCGVVSPGRCGVTTQ